jgi:Ni,Fe-hydrogenase I small subunit
MLVGVTYNDAEVVRFARLPLVDQQGRPAPVHACVVQTEAGKRMAFQVGRFGEKFFYEEPRDIALGFMLQREIAEDVASDFGEIG